MKLSNPKREGKDLCTLDGVSYENVLKRLQMFFGGQITLRSHIGLWAENLTGASEKRLELEVKTIKHI